MKLSRIDPPKSRGLTLLEVLVVVAILGILAAILFPALSKGKLMAEAAKNTYNLREITVSTLTWASDHGNRLPSPQYPGGMEPPEDTPADEYFPEHYDLGESGLWLDGVVFAQVYMKENRDGDVTQYDVNENGDHLKGTLFENTQAVKKNPDSEDWHELSYAMNANLRYDRIYDQVDSSDPYLTEKTLSNLIFAPKAMLYIENSDSNVVRHEDRDAILETMEERWDGKKAIAAFLDGHAERITEDLIPEEDPETDRESSWFWRGVNPE